MVGCAIRFCFNRVENEGDICESCQDDPNLTTVCSNMHCYKRAPVSHDPSRPAFCYDHKKKSRVA